MRESRVLRRGMAEKCHEFTAHRFQALAGVDLATDRPNENG